MPETVILVHGVLMPGVELRLLAHRLRRCGFDTVIFRYPSRRRDLRSNAAALARFAGSQQRPAVHCVGHSLGGLVILQALRQAGLPRGRVVLLGSPVQGSRAAQRLYQYAPGRWLLGKSSTEALLQQAPDWDYDRDIGIIAGDLPIGFGRVLADLPGEHDGTVPVAETMLAGATDRIVIPVSHTGLVMSRQVARQVCAFLQHGHFVPEMQVR
ncbi:MAG: alpha/beta hydrolase [Gammaproteobacteria bacterium]|nr:MAG: alpha/beta hydrolase [Gammaproteobacteria bacterium]